jgi:DNA-binding response OmpR family regulator
MDPVHRDPAPGTEREGEVTTMRVLLVDDEKEFVSTLAERLTLRGIEAEWTAAGHEALKLAEAGCFDIAVLDVKMPEMGGLKLKGKLQESCPGMRFLFLTGYGSEKDFRDVSRHVGEEFCLVKPVDIDDLIEKISAALQGKGGDE